MAATERRSRLSALAHGAVAFALLLSVPLWSERALSDARSSAALFVYTDDDQLTVLHPSATASAPVGEAAHVQAHYEADVITAATVDVRTAASARGFEETRHGLSIAAASALSRTLRADLTYAGSFSPDYETHSGAAGFALDDEERTRTGLLKLSYARDRVGRAGDAEPVGSIDSLAASLGLTVVLSTLAAGDLRLAVEHQRGYLESPYRFVPIAAADGVLDRAPLSVPERVPDQRTRGALEGGLRLSLTPHTFARGQWRLHADDWGVAGHTLRLRLSESALPPWIFSLFGSLYLQRAAKFYRGRYTTAPLVPSLRTLDRELAAGTALSVGVRVERELGELFDAQLRLDAQAEMIYQRYRDTPRLPERTSAIAGLTFSAEY